MNVSSAFIIGYSEAHFPNGRRESCDNDMLHRVWLPEGAAYELDDYEDGDRPAKVWCLRCAMESVPQQMVIEILTAQEGRWK